MQNSLIALLFFCIALSLQSYYFGFVRPPAVLAWLQKSAFITSTFLLIPVLVIGLTFQAGAIDRLRETGIQPYPGIIESVGVANGTGSEPTWVFKAQASVDEVIDFYQSGNNKGDWSYAGYNGLYLSFKKDDMKMDVYFREDWASDTLVYMLHKN